MLVAYGIACIVVCLVSFAHKPSIPYALTLFGAWLLGFMPIEVWSFVSLIEGAVFCCLLTWRSKWWEKTTAACVPLMLLADGYFWLVRSMGQYPGAVYENTLNVLFIIQLACTAYPGGRALVRHSSTWLGAVLDGRGWRAGVGVWQAYIASRRPTEKPVIVSNRRVDGRADSGLFVSARED